MNEKEKFFEKNKRRQKKGDDGIWLNLDKGERVCVRVCLMDVQY